MTWADPIRNFGTVAQAVHALQQPLKRKGHGQVDRKKVRAKNRVRNKIAKQSRKVNRGSSPRVPGVRAPWFWTTEVPRKCGYWAHVVNDTPMLTHPDFSVNALTDLGLLASTLIEPLPPLDPPCVRHLATKADLAYARERLEMCLAVDIPIMDRWSNRRLRRDELGGSL